MEGLRLSDAIEKLREELQIAQAKGQGQDLKFNVGAAEIEFEIVAGTEDSMSGKVSWYIFGGGLESKGKESSKHKLKLTLQPVSIDQRTGSPMRYQVNQESTTESR
jgi:Trypsin-co-occurring domain 2